MPMYLDCHVHLRDNNERYKETILHGLNVAFHSGVDAVFDMPNTNPPIITELVVQDRLQRAKESGVKEVFYGIYMGVTPDQEQVKRAIEIYHRCFPKVVGIKLYAGHSTNNMGVVLEEDQEKIYETFGHEGYKGVLAVHCEKESLLKKDVWNPSYPISHCFARPESSEIASVRDQITYAQRYDFNGKLHIVHVSSPIAVEMIDEARSHLDISCGVTLHHLVYDFSQMFEENGLYWKMNPPLRSSESQKRILHYLKEGKIDWIETDHAPHTLEEKLQHSFLSGIPGLPYWPLIEEFLISQNFSTKEIEKLTFTNVRDRFGIDIPQSRRKIKDRRRDYFNPYESLVKELRNKK